MVSQDRKRLINISANNTIKQCVIMVVVNLENNTRLPTLTMYQQYLKSKFSFSLLLTLKFISAALNTGIIDKTARITYFDIINSSFKVCSYLYLEIFKRQLKSSKMYSIDTHLLFAQFM